jgi:hypothetical protein
VTILSVSMIIVILIGLKSHRKNLNDENRQRSFKSD